ncbi:MAG: hypothetical protein GY749_39635 [Desulfobacteraceae bacterium]|nr:hypothetical protein [Desulfobacteraceae bacterium]
MSSFIKGIKNYFVKSRLSKRERILLNLNIRPYPLKDDIKDIHFNTDKIHALPLSFEDIDDDFTDIGDLGWLGPVAKETKVFMMGVTHYLKYIFNLRTRIFFALNKIDYFPFIILEYQYSKTPFVNYYLNLKDDNAANHYFVNVLDDFITTREELVLLNHIRRWNKLHADKPLKIGYSDIEFHYEFTFEKILIPFFKKMESSIDFKVGQGLSPKLIDDLKKLQKKAEKNGLVGDFPFITPGYIKNVISNIESFYNAQTYDFTHYRQKAIIRNLTDKDILGLDLTKGKTMISSGANHVPSNFKFPEQGAFLCEGSFLSHNFEPTKGKTFSVAALGFSCCLGDNPDMGTDFPPGLSNEYIYILKRMRDAVEKKMISPRKYYNIFRNPHDFEILLVKKAYEHNHKPLLLDNIPWDDITETFPDQSKITFAIKDYYSRFDRVIFVPRSPLISTRKKI